MNLENIIAVIVLYRSSLSKSESFKSLLKSIKKYNSELTLLVYNNSPEYWNYNQEQYPGLNMIYVEDAINSGVSKAYNTGFAYSKKSGKDFILLLDQDTLLPKQFFDFFFDYEQKYRNANIQLFCPMIINKNKLLSPANFFLFSSKKMDFISSGVHPLKGLAVINSGLVISTELFKQVGGYNEKIKLDFSDFDFLKRCRRFTDKIIVLDVQCGHELSGESEVSIQSALTRFDYYLDGAIYYKKSFVAGIGLRIWIFLRSIKLDIRYKTFSFTRKLFVSIIKS